jgi:hypothetical protein
MKKVTKMQIEILQSDVIEEILKIIVKRKASINLASIKEILETDLGECIMTVSISNPFVEESF